MFWGTIPDYFRYNAAARVCVRVWGELYCYLLRATAGNPARRSYFRTNPSGAGAGDADNLTGLFEFSAN